MRKVTREESIKILTLFFDKLFGNDIGSADKYWDFLDENGLLEQDENGEIMNSPSLIDFFLALGVQPAELIRVLNIVPETFTKELCSLYNVIEPISENNHIDIVKVFYDKLCAAIGHEIIDLKCKKKKDGKIQISLRFGEKL